jgi:hypothetical protein
MVTKTLMPFLLNIILLAGVHEGHANQRRFDSDQYNIARSQILDTRTHRKGVRDIIRSILDKRKRNNIPPAIEQKIQPPVEYYLDPPKFSFRDRSKLA